jgi:hypothetical protein
MDLSTLFSPGNVTWVSSFLVVLIFMPLAAWTFVSYFMARKDQEFKKSTEDMGIHTSRTVWDVYKGSRYILPVGFATLVCLIGAANMGELWRFEDAASRTLSAMAWAFMGGFCFSAFNILRRIVSYDLPPDVFYQAAIRILLSGLLAALLSFLLPSEEGVVNLTFGLPAIAFLTGFFPDSILYWLSKKYQQFFNPNPINNETLSLLQIEGMSALHRERLIEVGIDNAQNLASSSLTKLMIETPFNNRVLLDWMGQAKLLCYAKDKMPFLREAGIRTVYDLMTADKNPQMIVKMADAIGMSPIMLQNIFLQINADKGIQALDIFQKKMNGDNTDEETSRADTNLPPEMANGSTMGGSDGTASTEPTFDPNIPDDQVGDIPVEEDPRSDDDYVGNDDGPTDVIDEAGRHPLDIPQDMDQANDDQAVG